MTHTVSDYVLDYVMAFVLSWCISLLAALIFHPTGDHLDLGYFCLLGNAARSGPLAAPHKKVSHVKQARH